MPEKRVILCEGIHDVYFFSLLLEQKQIKHKTVTNEELGKKQNSETLVIRDFINPRKGKGIRYLIKDEGGNLRCIENFKVLYEQREGSFVMFLCLDSDSGNLKRLRRETSDRFREDILVPMSDNFHLTKSKTKHSVFFIPDSLESQVRAITGKNIDRTDRDHLKKALQKFIETCREQEIDWFIELETVLFN